MSIVKNAFNPDVTILKLIDDRWSLNASQKSISDGNVNIAVAFKDAYADFAGIVQRTVDFEGLSTIVTSSNKDSVPVKQEVTIVNAIGPAYHRLGDMLVEQTDANDCFPHHLPYASGGPIQFGNEKGTGSLSSVRLLMNSVLNSDTSELLIIDSVHSLDDEDLEDILLREHLHEDVKEIKVSLAVFSLMHWSAVTMADFSDVRVQMDDTNLYISNGIDMVWEHGLDEEAYNSKWLNAYRTYLSQNSDRMDSVALVYALSKTMQEVHERK